MRASLIAQALQQQVLDLICSGETDWTPLQINCANALNFRSRSMFFWAVRDQCPETLPLLASCYAAPIPLYCGRQILRSTRGVQQGDPCWPAAFALGIQSAVENNAPL